MDKQCTPKGYLFLHNISKKTNIGTIIRSACAFGFSKIFYISNRPQGSKKIKAIKEFHCFGNQGTYNQIQFHPFYSFAEAKNYFQENGIRVCGVQIGETSQPVQSHPFKGDTAIFLGNEGTGILPVHKEICDHFVYIPQYTDKTASLNVGVAAGIVFHHFASWAQFPESKVFGQKFQYQEDPKGQPRKKEQGSSEQQINLEKQSIKAEQTLKAMDELPDFQVLKQEEK